MSPETLSYTEENYLKALYKLCEAAETSDAGTNELAHHLGIRPASVNDMLKKLAEKNLIHYQKYKKIRLTGLGKEVGVDLIRKHRLWETFLSEKLNFSWDEVHEIAEELEHIKSNTLTDRLEAFLGFPEKDPHGHPIPRRQTSEN